MAGSTITLIAGPAARERILNEGLKPSLFRAMVAASGGPKWFVLKALDQFLFGKFFASRNEPIATLGTSVGAWQMACFAQKNPVAAIERLAAHYSRTAYSDKPTPREISESAEVIVDEVLGPSGAQEVATNPLVQTHIIINRCKGLVASETPPVQLMGLTLAAMANAGSRRNLGWFFERVVMHAGSQAFFDLEGFGTRYGPLNAENLRDTLLATASIPMVLEGVRNVPGAPRGTYRDGGITDYHFDIPFCRAEQGLVIYPHFSQKVTAGWFDKSLRWRRVNPAHYDNVMIVAPSSEFVGRLPFGKIPDRKDFKHLDNETRLKSWARVLDLCRHLAEDFDALCHRPLNPDEIRPFCD